MHVASLLTLALTAFLTQAFVPSAHPSSPLLAPSDDPFYVVPKDIQEYSPGDVLDSRHITSTIIDENLAASYQVAYRTSGALLEPDATVATIWTPKTPTWPTKVLVYQVFEDAVQLDCAPSWAFVNGSASKSFLSAAADAPTYIKWALSQGIYVVLSDSFGSRSAFGVPAVEGYTILDGIRATLTFLKLPAKTDLALGGHWSVAHAANLAGVYAPELNILGAVHGGTPVDAADNYKYLLGGPASAYSGLIVAGMMRAYPQFSSYMDGILTQAGHDHIYKLFQRGVCVLQAIPAGANVNYSAETTIGPDWIDKGFPKKLFERVSLLPSVNPTGVYAPVFPTVQFHAAQDDLVPRSLHEQFVEEQCHEGAAVLYAVLPVKNHASATFYAIPGAIKALDKIFSRSLDLRKCGQSSYSQALFIRPDSSEAIALLGQDEAKRINAFNGQQSFVGPIAW